MYNIAICEDDIVQLKTMSNLLNNYSLKKNIKFNINSFSSGEKFLNSEQLKYDIIFLDIQMNEINGIEVAKIIRKTNDFVKIIFITALEKYWSLGYSVNAFRYILKPLKEEDFYIEMNSLFYELNKNKKFLTISHKETIKNVLISDISYLEIRDRKVAIHTNLDTYFSTYKLSYWNETLSPLGFANPHNSFLVNLNYISTMDKEKLTLLNGESIYFSKRKYKEFKTRFIEFVAEI